MNQEEEVWKEIAGYEGWYSVSSMGRVRRDKKTTHRHRNGPTSGYLRKDGYMNVFISNTTGVFKTYTVHKLVAEAFHGPRPRGMEVNHINGIKDDNRACNLEWVTPTGNQLHCSRVLMRRQGLKPTPQFGEDHHHSRFTSEQILEIRRLYASGQHSQREIAKMFSSQQSYISEIVRRKVWPHLPAIEGEAVPPSDPATNNRILNN